MYPSFAQQSRQHIDTADCYFHSTLDWEGLTQEFSSPGILVTAYDVTRKSEYITDSMHGFVGWMCNRFL